MKFYRLPQTDLKVSRIGFGAGFLDASRKAVDLVKTAYDNGITLFDVSDVYNEESFGDVLRRSPGLRQRIVIQSKCGLVFGQCHDDDHTYKIRLDSSSQHIVDAAEGSLRRLGVDHLDILLLHWPDALAEPQEIATAFDLLSRSGKVQYFGVSNHTPAQIELLQKTLRQRLVIDQIYLSLENSYLVAGGLVAMWDNSRTPYDSMGPTGTVDYCRLNGIQVQAYSPLRGVLFNRPANVSSEMMRAAETLQDLANERNVTSSAIALAWLLRHPAGIVPIISSANPKHVIENCAADDLELSREEWYRLLAATFSIKSRATC